MSECREKYLGFAVEPTMGTPHPTSIATIRALKRRLEIPQLPAPWTGASTGHQWVPAWQSGCTAPPRPRCCVACGLIEAPVIPVPPSTERWVEFLPPFGQRREPL